MPILYAELEEDTFTYEDDWRELLDSPGSPPEDAISNSAMEATITGVIDFNKIRSCARHFLGYSYTSTDSSDFDLHREPPAAHPRWPNLYAHGISFRGLNPKSNPENPNGEPYTTSPFDVDLYTSTFEKAVVTVRFRSFGRMRFLPDEDIENYQDEWKRWVQWQTAPRVEALSADGASQLRFAEGGTYLGMAGPTAGQTPFPAPVAVLLAKCQFVMTWMHVPHDYLSADPDILIPTNVLNIMGKTNADPFLGFDAGVLLAEAPAFEPVLFPAVAADPFDLIGGWNVHVGFNYFNPANAAGSSYRGHNLMPFRNGGFYLATRNGSATGPKLLPETDFIDLFKHVGAP
jgi:hypothetical protein